MTHHQILTIQIVILDDQLLALLFFLSKDILNTALIGGVQYIKTWRTIRIWNDLVNGNLFKLITHFNRIIFAWCRNEEHIRVEIPLRNRKIFQCSNANPLLVLFRKKVRNETVRTVCPR